MSKIGKFFKKARRAIGRGAAKVSRAVSVENKIAKVLPKGKLRQGARRVLGQLNPLHKVALAADVISGKKSISQAGIEAAGGMGLAMRKTAMELGRKSYKKRTKRNS